MKKILLSVFFLTTLFLMPLAAQEELIVEPGPAGTLNQAITNPANQGKILVLRRGIPYLVTGEINFSAAPLHIKAEPGNGPRPLIVFSPGGGGAAPDQVIRANNHLTLEGLHLTNRDLLGGITERIIRTSAADLSIRVNDCLIDDSGQTAFRLDGTNNKIYATNSIFSRMGIPSNPDNGRVLDDRGTLVDTIWFENCLMYNVTSRIIRDGGQRINVAIFNQNTVSGVGQRGFEWGEIEQLYFTNNIIADGGFLGRQFSLDPAEQDNERHVINGAPVGNANWVIRNNNFFRSVGALAATPFTQADTDTIEQQPYFNAAAVAAIQAGGWQDTNIEEQLEFANPAPTPVDFITKHHAGQSAQALPWDHSGLAINNLYSQIGNMTPRYSTFHDYGYRTDTDSYTGGTDGQPLGANLFSFISSAQDLFVENNILFYPNPVRDILWVQNLEAENLAGVRVFDMQGRPLRTWRINEDYLMIDTSNWSNGMYILSVTDRQGRTSSQKFIKH